jgi:ChrR Cupin-like domain
MKEEREFFSAEEVPWEHIEGPPGLSERILAGDKRTSDHSRMLKFEPGTVTDETLVHDFWEEVWILEGSLRDLRLGQTFTAGMYACRPPGMPHGPWDTEEGCITFEVRYSDPRGGK